MDKTGDWGSGVTLQTALITVSSNNEPFPVIRQLGRKFEL